MIKDKRPESIVYFFSDGSFFYPNRGAWGVVKVVLHGDEMLLEHYSGIISCANSLTPEVIAAYQSLMLAKQHDFATVVVDNSNVYSHLKHAKVKPSGRTPGGYVCAFWLRKLDAMLRFIERDGVEIFPELVKAHKPLSALPQSPKYQEFLRWGNALADRLAKKTARADVEDCTQDNAWTVIH